MIKRASVWVLAALTLGCGGREEPAPNAGPDADPDVAPLAGASVLPSGIQVRLDRSDADPADFHVSAQDGGWDVKTGAHGIAYDPRNIVRGDYTVSAEFTEMGAPADHREGLGLFFGGMDLSGAAQRYSYFLVRADGRYLIKRRSGEGTLDVTDGWIQEESVRTAAGGADVTNILSVTRVGGLMHFTINGAQVATLPTSELDTDGMVGVRVSHNLHVRIERWTVTP